MSNNDLVFGINEIIDFQQNRYPMLFVDKVVSINPGKSATGLKNFTYNEWFFPSHFPGDPNVPGFIQIETLVQVFLLTFLSIPGYKGMKTSFVSLNNVKFKKKILPGDCLEIYSELISFKRGIASGFATSKVGTVEATSAEFKVSIPEVLDKFKPGLRS